MKAENMRYDDIMLYLIKNYFLCKKNYEYIEKNNLEEIFYIMKKHDIAHIGAITLAPEILIDEKIRKDFQDSQLMAVVRYEKNKFERERIYNIFEENKILFIPLKGAVISDYYYENWHRTSCDTDILIHESDLPKALELLESRLNYSYKGKSKHDVSLFSPSGVHLELHYDFDEEKILVNEAWENASALDGWNYQYRFSNEYFILHNIAHLAKHFKYAGFGIRAFMDLWVIKHNMNYDAQILDDMLADKELKKFADVMFNLIEVWFGEEKADKLSDEISSYVLNSGIYGNVENRVAIGQINKKGKLNYAMSRIFLNYEALKYPYPVLIKHRYMLPFCQIHRWLRLIKSKGVKAIHSEFEINSNIDDSHQKEVSKMFFDLGI